jgi:Flp pilus assembly protein TadG
VSAPRHRRRPWWLRWRDDRGGVAAIVAILFGGGVLLGMTALTIDVGQIYVERQELQSGADAAATAIAQDCANTSIAECRTRADALANRYADLNAKDDDSGVIRVCVKQSIAEGPCSAGNGNLTDCIEKIPPNTPYVEVQTRTRQRGGSKLAPTFARALNGNSNYAGTEVAACSRSTWRLWANYVAGITISECEYEESLENYGENMAIGLRHKPRCGGVPSGFGFVKGPGDCTSAVGATLTDAEWRQPKAEYERTRAACKNLMDKAIDSKDPIRVPLYSTWDSNTARKYYNLTGNEAGFVVTGYEGIAGIPTDRKVGDCKCTNKEGCVYGYFLPGFGPGK